MRFWPFSTKGNYTKPEEPEQQKNKTRQMLCKYLYVKGHGIRVYENCVSLFFVFVGLVVDLLACFGCGFLVFFTYQNIVQAGDSTCAVQPRHHAPEQFRRECDSGAEAAVICHNAGFEFDPRPRNCYMYVCVYIYIYIFMYSCSQKIKIGKMDPRGISLYIYIYIYIYINV